MITSQNNDLLVKEEEEENIYEIHEIHINQEEGFYGNYSENIPIAIDLGSSFVRAGVVNQEEPNNVFPCVISRYRDRKASKTLTIIGNDAYLDPLLRSSIKSPYDGPLISNWDHIEYIFDYTFEHLCVLGSNGGVNNPIIITEPVACPFGQRKNMYEIFFEAYQVPKIVFGIDSLFSYYQNCTNVPHGIVIGTGHNLTHIIPVLNGQGMLLQAKRIDWGGNLCLNFLHKLLSLKYPQFPLKFTVQQMTQIFQDHCLILLDYQKDLSSVLDINVLKNFDVVIQFPYDTTNLHEKKKSSEELAKLAQKKKEQGKRLQEHVQQRKIEKLNRQKKEYDYFVNLRDFEFLDLSNEKIQSRLNEDGFKDIKDFNKYLTFLEKSIKKSQSNESGVEDDTVDMSSNWPLIDIPDDQLTEEKIKEKRKQKLIKGNYENRERLKQIKKQQMDAKTQYEKEQEEWRKSDLDDWCKSKKIELNDCIIKYKKNLKLLESFKDRKSIAAQQRMKSIANLANNEVNNSNAVSKRKRRLINSTIDNDPSDTFGENDEDWSVYRKINNCNLEEEQDKLNLLIHEIEETLLKHDPSFKFENTFAASQSFDWKNLVMHKFLHGSKQDSFVSIQSQNLDRDETSNHPDIIKKNHQIHLNIERIRVPEILFQPDIAGLDQAGISETLYNFMKKLFLNQITDNGVAYNPIQDIFITGGLSCLKNFTQRVHRDFQSFFPENSVLNVRKASNSLTDPWKGMRKWSMSEESAKSYVSKKEYEEFGPEYIKDHNFGNICLI